MTRTMTITPDWAAPIIPGESMMGFTLGTSRSDVLAALMAHRCDFWHRKWIRFANSPVLIADTSEGDLINLRGAAIKKLHYPYQNELARLVFKDGHLSTIIVSPAAMDDNETHYHGKLCDKVGLLSPVADLMAYGQFEYDPDDEEFYPVSGLDGMIVCSGRASDLVAVPDQVITFIRIQPPILPTSLPL